MNRSKSQFWIDYEKGKIYKINKQTGQQHQITRNYQKKKIYDNALTGKATYKMRIQKSKPVHHPQVPLYLKRQTSLLKKYQSNQKINAEKELVTTKKKSLDTINKNPNQITNNINNIRYNVSQTIQQLTKKQQILKKNQYIEKYFQISTQRQTPIRYTNNNVYDQSQFFQLTRYNSKTNRNIINQYKFSINPEHDDHLKPIPTNHYSIINKKYYQKKKTIHQLEDKLIQNFKKNSLQKSIQKTSMKTQEMEINSRPSRIPTIQNIEVVKGTQGYESQKSQKSSIMNKQQSKNNGSLYQATLLNEKNYNSQCKMKQKQSKKKQRQKKQKLLIQKVLIRMNAKRQKQQFEAYLNKRS